MWGSGYTHTRILAHIKFIIMIIIFSFQGVMALYSTKL